MENQNQSVRVYAPQYRNVLSTVFDVRKAFAGVLAPIQVLDGVQMNATAFKVKTSDTPVVVGTYNKGANIGMGTGTGKTSRFGDRKEIIYTDTDVPYDYDLTIHEGLDRYTVNNDLDAAVADRFKLQSEAQTRFMNEKIGAHLSSNAKETKTLSAFDEAAIKSLFNAIKKYYVDHEVTAPVKAYVTTDLKTAIVDMQSTTTAKGSSVSIDDNDVVKYKGFVLEETPEKYFVAGDIAYFSPDRIVNPFVGISTARTIESEDFDGVALQAAAKGGTFTLEDNKAAIVKVKTP
ncbi:phage capsid protein [Pseudolactococcus yaeyamensis]